MQLRWALLLGLVAGVAVAWWLSRDTPEQAREKRARAEQAAAADYADSRPVLYRWRDDSGAPRVPATPPKRRRSERIPIAPDPASSQERRVEKEGVRTVISRWARYTANKKHNTNNNKPQKT